MAYILSGNRWAYLAIIINLFARKIVAKKMSLSLDTNLTLKALEFAYKSKGSTSGRYFTKTIIAVIRTWSTSRLIRYKVAQSMSRRRNYRGNAPMEPFQKL